MLRKSESPEQESMLPSISCDMSSVFRISAIGTTSMLNKELCKSTDILFWTGALCVERANLYTSRLSTLVKTKCYPSMMEGVQCNQSAHKQAG